MTCIVGIADGDRVLIGGDSAGVAGWSMSVRADQKVFSNGSFVMGFTTSFRMGQLSRYSLKPPVPPADADLDRFMVTSFVDAVRECFKTGGWREVTQEREAGGTFLVGYAGRLFVIDSDFQVGVPADGFAAVGCGSDIALGARSMLHAAKRRKRG